MRPYIIGFIALFLVVAAWFFMKPSKKSADQQLTAVVKKGVFKVSVTASGELQARNSEKILGPQNGMRMAGIWQTAIQDIIEEGTVVKEGDYVAQLDKTAIADKLSAIKLELDQIEARLTQTTLDTALDLRATRDQLVNLSYTMREKNLEMEQSKYEPPAVINRVKLDLERTQRDYDQLVQNMKLKKQQAEAKVAEITATLQQKQATYDRLMELGSQFTITAPKGGMLIYYGGNKQGSQIGAWDPVVAELPDLSSMISKTYINEIDISKVKKGQRVTVKIDAFPDRSYSGTVFQVANVGQQLPSFDAKVFEVNIQLDQSDTIMRPAMTTSNEILVAEYPDLISMPMEALFHTDSLTFALVKKDGVPYRQEIITGITNDNEVVVEHGLNSGDEVYLSLPDKVEDLPLKRLPKEITDEYKRKRVEEEMRRKTEQEMARKAMEEALQSAKIEG